MPSWRVGLCVCLSDVLGVTSGVWCFVLPTDGTTGKEEEEEEEREGRRKKECDMMIELGKEE